MEYKRLTKQAGWHKDIDLTDELGYSYIYQRLAELENKIEQGTLIELPCKVGDTVYTIEKFGWQDRWRVEKNYCNSITFDGDKFFINREVYEYDGCYGYAFGEDAFLTREEAEKKLKELQE